MYELLWFIGGAITYQLLSRILKVAQLYIFFQEVHMHALLMLDAAAQDIETAQDEDEMIGAGAIILLSSAPDSAVAVANPDLKLCPE